MHKLKTQLYSESITSKLVMTLIALILPFLLFTGLELAGQLQPSVNNNDLFVGLVSFSALVYMILLLLIVIFVLRWVYVVHKDINEKDADYPITPGQALLAFMAPIYNIWGIWNCLHTMQKYFKNKDARAFRMNMDQLINLFYVGWIFSVGTSIATSSDDNGSVGASMLSAFASIASWLAIFGIVLVTRRNLAASKL
jgi:hypothetical protein